jgi:hypothetical protein
VADQFSKPNLAGAYADTWLSYHVSVKVGLVPQGLFNTHKKVQ